MKIDQRIAAFIKSEETPFLALDLDIVRAKFNKLRESLPNIDIYYAVKANNLGSVLSTLKESGCGFDIASEEELKQVLGLGVVEGGIVCLHPIKSPNFINQLRKSAIQILAVDSREEVDKIAKFFPKALLVSRLVVDNVGSDWPLTRKFGLSFLEVVALIKYIKKKGLNAYGLTFHVGSQCRNPSNWATALALCREVWLESERLGIHLRYLSLGGGIPIAQDKPIPSIPKISSVILSSLKREFGLGDSDSLSKVSIEPGRGIVGDSGTMVSSVVGKARRGDENWLYLDIGVFNGLAESIEKYSYKIGTSGRGEIGTFNLAGPTCDSVDIIAEGVVIRTPRVGDKIYVFNSAAYTIVYGSEFNGFVKPRVVYI